MCMGTTWILKYLHNKADSYRPKYYVEMVVKIKY